jgi:hypothetical protein
MQEYHEDLFDDLPLFSEPRGPADLTPPSWGGDPPTAKAAAQSPEAKRSVVRGTARCLLLLLGAADGLTDSEAVDAYFVAYPDEVQGRGATGCFRAAIRSWCMLKPNDDKRNWKKENLNLIHQLEQVRINPWSQRPNVVFGFITPPTEEQVAAWEQLAYEYEQEAVS